jgi:hypothetical protein
VFLKQQTRQERVCQIAEILHRHELLFKSIPRMTGFREAITFPREPWPLRGLFT